MSSLTIDQLKKSLSEQGVALPPSGSKKAEYVKLYEQYSTLNENLGDTYSSDDESNSKTDSQNVSSSTSPSKVDSITKEVEQLSNDELYTKLREFGENIGPVLINTRRVYEKKLIKLLSSNRQTNGYDTTNSHKEVQNARNDEFSDSDVELSKVAAKKSERSKRSSVQRESPKPSLQDSRDVTPQNESSSYSRAFQAKSTRISYIETIPKGSSQRFIEPAETTDFLNKSRVRSRYSLDRSYGNEEPYIGKWEPSVSRLGSTAYAKTTGKSQGRSWGKTIFGGKSFENFHEAFF